VSKEEDLSKRRYKRAWKWAVMLAGTVLLALSALSVLVAIIFLEGPLYADYRSGGGAADRIESEQIATASLVTIGISFLAMMVAAMGTSSSILLGWRADRRQTEEFQLKIHQLERKLAKSKVQDGRKTLDIDL
jgi:ABC-type Fe3+ transport system permease subunit